MSSVSGQDATRLIVIGAGPKALALAAKSRTLSKLGLNAPGIVVVEKSEVAAHWDGQHGYTDGRQPLGTPPEKDIGFPYRSTVWGREYDQRVDDEMLHYSWHRFLTMRGTYMSWLDRGRHQPTHGEWGEYLKWVAQEADVEILRGEVVSLGVSSGKWHISFGPKGNSRVVVGDGLVITGPGAPPSLPPDIKDAKNKRRFLNPISFWQNHAQFEHLEYQRVCLIGVGETAAAIACALVDRMRPTSSLMIVAPHGAIFSRGENYFENKLFSDPTGWTSLSRDHRRDFINRADRGVFSQAAQERINLADNVQCIPGRVEHVDDADGSLRVVIKYGEDVQPYPVDYIIDAANLDRTWFIRLLDQSARAALTNVLGKPTLEAMESSMDESLAVRGLHPYMHLPMLAALPQGPGFPNLSSLGLLSDRILRRYVPKHSA